MNKTFKEWFDEQGYEKFDEVLEWLEEAPDTVDLGALLDGVDIEQYAYEVVENVYDGICGDYEGRAYDEYRDSLLDEEL